MPTTFGREILGRAALDESGDRLGHMADFPMDTDTGSIVSLLVSIEPDIDLTMLPWPTVVGLISVPVEEVANVGASVQVAR